MRCLALRAAAVTQSLGSWTRPLRSCSKQGQLRSQIRASGLYLAKSWKSPGVETAQTLGQSADEKIIPSLNVVSAHAHCLLSSHQTLTGPAELLLDQSTIFSRLNKPSSLSLLRHMLHTIGHTGGSLTKFVLVYYSLYCSWMQNLKRGPKCRVYPKSGYPIIILIHLVVLLSEKCAILIWGYCGTLAEVKINNTDCLCHPQKSVFTTENHHWVTECLVSSHWLSSVTFSFISIEMLS